jgi:hypothetical protein
MSEIVYWLLALKINPGQETEFRTISAKLIESARQEPGCLNYEWTLSEDGQVCHIYERYADSAAVKLHSERNGSLVGQLFNFVTPLSFTIYGSPDEEVKRGLVDMQPVYMKALGGFSR